MNMLTRDRMGEWMRMSMLCGIVFLLTSGASNPGPALAAETLDDKLARNEAVRIALRRPLSDVRFERTPLREVVAKMRGLLRVNIHVQWSTLEDNGISDKRPISLTLKRITGERLLQLILDDVDVDVELGFAIQDGVLVISLRETLSSTMSLRTYSVRHLILANRDPAVSVDWSGDDLKERAARFASALVDLVYSDSWNVNGGTGSLELDEGLLIIRQAREIHEEVKALLEALARVPPNGSTWVHEKSAVALAEQRAIQDALERVQPTVSLTNTTLKDAFDWLRLMLGVNMYVQWWRLETIGVEADSRVELRLKNVSLGRVLDQLLSDASNSGLTYEIIDGVLVVSTTRFFNRPNKLRVHEVRASAPDRVRRERLVQLIADMAEPDSWRINGGSGEARFVADRLVVRNSGRTHAAVDELLTEMRAHRARTGAREAPPKVSSP